MFYPIFFAFIISFGLGGCTDQGIKSENKEVLPGAYRTSEYIPMIKEKSIGLVVNQTSFVQNRHLLDTLLSHGIQVNAVFAPEHGFRGEASAGAHIEDQKDPKTGIPIISIYGKSKKPSVEQLEGIDMVIFDIQDVGARFYTYIATLEYVMEACAENNIPVIILDRPNPNGHYVDGPILDPAYQSFVGRHSIPIVHGLTVGEYGQMLNGEGWLKDGVQCDLTVITCQNYNHNDEYILPIRPSPNLPNQRSIYMYPSLCLFEGTTASVGRGTEKQFQVILHPDYPKHDFADTPIKRPGAKWPKHENIKSYGIDLSPSNMPDFERPQQINLNYLIDFYKALDQPDNFFLENNFIDKLAGTQQLRLDIISGKSANEIRRQWVKGLEKYIDMRKKYLLYSEN